MLHATIAAGRRWLHHNIIKIFMNIMQTLTDQISCSCVSNIEIFVVNVMSPPLISLGSHSWHCWHEIVPDDIPEKFMSFDQARDKMIWINWILLFRNNKNLSWRTNLEAVTKSVTFLQFLSHTLRICGGTAMIFLITTCVNAKSMNSFRECVVIMGAGLGVTNIMDIF